MKKTITLVAISIIFSLFLITGCNATDTPDTTAATLDTISTTDTTAATSDTNTATDACDLSNEELISIYREKVIFPLETGFWCDTNLYYGEIHIGDTILASDYWGDIYKFRKFSKSDFDFSVSYVNDQKMCTEMIGNMHYSGVNDNKIRYWHQGGAISVHENYIALYRLGKEVARFELTNQKFASIFWLHDDDPVILLLNDNGDLYTLEVRYETGEFQDIVKLSDHVIFVSPYGTVGPEQTGVYFVKEDNSIWILNDLMECKKVEKYPYWN